MANDKQAWEERVKRELAESDDKRFRDQYICDIKPCCPTIELTHGERHHPLCDNRRRA